MSRRTVLSASERDSLLALPTDEDELMRHYAFSEAAIARWNTVYLERIITYLRDQGEPVDEQLIPYLSPLSWDHINMTGDYVRQPRRGVSSGQLRPLRGGPKP